MLTAQEARDLADNYEDTLRKASIYPYVIDAIEREAREGNYKLTIGLHKYQAQKIRDLGYSVVEKDDLAIISWGKD